MPKTDSDTLYGSVCHADALMSMYCASQQLTQLLAQPLSLQNKLSTPQLLSRQLGTRTQYEYNTILNYVSGSIESQPVM